MFLSNHKKLLITLLVGLLIIGIGAIALSFKDGSKRYADAILACYHQNPGSDANEPIPNNSIQNVKETSRMFINMPKDLYPKDISHSWTTVTGNATGGYVSNGGLPGEAGGALPGCWSTYVDFEGNGEVDLRVKSIVDGVPDYFVRFIVPAV